MQTPRRLETHLRSTLRWSTGPTSGWRQGAAAALAMAVPTALGIGSGHAAAGLAVALGALLAAPAAPEGAFGAHVRVQARTLLPALLAAALGVACAGHGAASRIALVALVALAATVRTFNRTVAVAATRFILFLLIVVASTGTAPNFGARQPLAFFALICAGTFWACALYLAAAALTPGTPAPAAPTARPEPPSTLRQKLARWRRSLRAPRGWSYPLRLVPCIAIATTVDGALPGHHMSWIGLTVALLIGTHAEPWSIKATQRTLGTAIGVALMALLLAPAMPAWALVGLVALLAGTRPLLRAGNYLLYSIAITPLIILVIDAGQTADRRILAYRLCATLVGAGLVAVANALYLRYVGPGRRPRA